jgi:large subunit ribosomal protein L23
MGKLILTRPVISEKAFALQEADKYVFHVSPEANKAQIKSEVERLFKVTVVNVQTVRIPGKVKRFGKLFGRRKDIKKAIVTIKKGQKIEEFKA